MYVIIILKDINTFTGIMRHVLNTVKEIIPELKCAYFRQDNAECYHSAQKMLALQRISQEVGVNISGVDFSDPQGGKESCDRKAATIESHVRNRLNEGNYVEITEDSHRVERWS